MMKNHLIIFRQDFFQQSFVVNLPFYNVYSCLLWHGAIMMTKFGKAPLFNFATRGVLDNECLSMNSLLIGPFLCLYLWKIESEIIEKIEARKVELAFSR